MGRPSTRKVATRKANPRRPNPARTVRTGSDSNESESMSLGCVRTPAGPGVGSTSLLARHGRALRTTERFCPSRSTLRPEEGQLPGHGPQAAVTRGAAPGHGIPAGPAPATWLSWYTWYRDTVTTTHYCKNKLDRQRTFKGKKSMTRCGGCAIRRTEGGGGRRAIRFVLSGP
jgi:hypothetical protein